MSTKLSFDPARHPALVALRMVVAVLLLIHGVARMALGLVDDFGVFLAAVGFPLAHALAWAVTVMEIVGSLLLGLGWHVRILGLYFAAQLLAGIVLVHAAEGWFVVEPAETEWNTASCSSQSYWRWSTRSP